MTCCSSTCIFLYFLVFSLCCWDPPRRGSNFCLQATGYKQNNKQTVLALVASSVVVAAARAAAAGGGREGVAVEASGQLVDSILWVVIRSTSSCQWSSIQHHLAVRRKLVGSYLTLSCGWSSISHHLASQRRLMVIHSTSSCQWSSIQHHLAVRRKLVGSYLTLSCGWSSIQHHFVNAHLFNIILLCGGS